MPDNPRAYLYRMAGNIAIDHLRRIQRQSRLEGHSPDDAEARSDGRADEIASPAPIADEIVAAREELSLLDDAIRDLPERCRHVFLLYRGEGLTMREVAARLGISQRTVENHIARATLHCRRTLRKAGRKV
jgi:RNA polymerase sigma-70 factor (ECF subfamily)